MKIISLPLCLLLLSACDSGKHCDPLTSDRGRWD
jgi:hypothetical protein